MSQKTYVMKALYYTVMLPTTDSINAADFAIFNAGINLSKIKKLVFLSLNIFTNIRIRKKSSKPNCKLCFPR